MVDPRLRCQHKYILPVINKFRVFKINKFKMILKTLRMFSVATSTNFGKIYGVRL